MITKFEEELNNKYGLTSKVWYESEDSWKYFVTNGKGKIKIVGVFHKQKNKGQIYYRGCTIVIGDLLK